MMTYSTDHRGNYNGPKFGPVTVRQATAAEWAALLPLRPPTAWYASFDAAVLTEREKAADDRKKAAIRDRFRFDRAANGEVF